MNRTACKLLSALLPGLLLLGCIAWGTTTPAREPAAIRFMQDGQASPLPDREERQRSEETGKRRHRPIQTEDAERPPAAAAGSTCPAPLSSGTASAGFHVGGSGPSAEAPLACDQPRLRLKLLLGQAP